MIQLLAIQRSQATRKPGPAQARKDPVPGDAAAPPMYVREGDHVREGLSRRTVRDEWTDGRDEWTTDGGRKFDKRKN